MIKIFRLHGGNCPRFCCNVCGEPIEKDGMARWDPNDPEGRVEHVHKRTCDLQTDPKRHLYWENIDTHLIYLRDNLKISKKEWKEAEKRADWCEAIYG